MATLLKTNLERTQIQAIKQMHTIMKELEEMNLSDKASEKVGSLMELMQISFDKEVTTEWWTK